MWHREDLKERARFAMKDHGYWKPVLASWIILIFTGSLGLTGNAFNLIYRFSGPNTNQYFEEMQRNLPLSAGFWGALGALALAYFLLIVNPLNVGRNRYYLEHRSRRLTLSTLFQPFRAGYINTVMTMGMTGLITFLWSLLLLVPGIIKSYQYFFVPAILAENPNIHWRRAMRLSRDMTQGSKMDIWVMELSFLGWIYLSLVVSGLIVFALNAPFSDAFGSLFGQLRVLTRGMPEFMEWFFSVDMPISFPQGYATRFIALNLSGLALFYLSGLLSSPLMILVTPYYHGSFADLYAVLRARALVAGLATREELPGFDWTDEHALEEAILAEAQSPKVLTEEQPQNPPE